MVCWKGEAHRVASIRLRHDRLAAQTLDSIRRLWWMLAVHFTFLFCRPSVMAAYVYWSRIFANLDALQRAVIGRFWGLRSCLGDLRLRLSIVWYAVWGTMFYKPPFGRDSFPIGDFAASRCSITVITVTSSLFVIFHDSVLMGSRITEFQNRSYPADFNENTVPSLSHYDHWTYQYARWDSKGPARFTDQLS